MQRFDERLLLREIYGKMADAEHRAVIDRELRTVKRSEPTHRQRLAHLLIKLANGLTLGSCGELLKDERTPTRARAGVAPSEPFI